MQNKKNLGNMSGCSTEFEETGIFMSLGMSNILLSGLYCYELMWRILSL